MDQAARPRAPRMARSGTAQRSTSVTCRPIPPSVFHQLTPGATRLGCRFGAGASPRSGWREVRQSCHGRVAKTSAHCGFSRIHPRESHCGGWRFNVYRQANWMAEISLSSRDLSGDCRDAWSGAETPSPCDGSGGRPVGRRNMRKFVGGVVCLVPLTAYAQQTYTNEDLRKFSVPGAYTNQDLKKMRPLPVSGKAGSSASTAPAETVDSRPYQMRLDLLLEQRL